VLDASFPGGKRYTGMNITTKLKAAFTIAIFLAAVAVHAATLTVFAAASLTDSLREIGRDYEHKTGDKIQFNFAASSVLERQIEAGAPADIFFSADEAKMNALEKKGLIDNQTRHSRLSNSLVIVTPLDSSLTIHSPQDLASDAIKHIALADPQAVPAGVYAKEYLNKIHLWSQLAPKVVAASNVRAALAFVASGDADAGFVYKTDAAISKKVRVAFAVPPAEGPKISYPMAMVSATTESGAARAFLKYLDSDAAAKVFEKYGFTLAGRAP
jgi:molybdate transport system substrate-binding protein